MDQEDGKFFQFIRLEFIRAMDAELLSNSAHKGDWLNWQPEKLLLAAELNWHLAKLVQALLDGDRAKTTEYAADLANYSMKADEIYGQSGISTAKIINENSEENP